MSMLQDVIHSLDVPAAASGSGSAALSLSTGGSLAVVDVEKAKQTTAPGATLGTIPHLVESTRRAVLSLPSDLEFQRVIDVFRSFQERSHQLEQECARLIEALRVQEVEAKSFAVERADHAVQQEKLESRYKSLNKKYQELKKQEAAARSQVIDWRNAHDQVADEAEHLWAALTEAQATCEHQRDRKMKNGVMLAMAMVAYRDHAQTLGRFRGELRELSGAAEDLVNAIAPVEEGAGPQSLVERLRATPGKVAGLCKTVCKQVLAVVKSYYSRADLAAAGDGVARNAQRKHMRSTSRRRSLLQPRCRSLSP
ncbi:uncharacterized protein [Setaria viridis]|uniref:Uncharacterized protein n=1 Tax=Setaria viridis TaxID=4556 RepID=A0A4U6VSB2_SETVI|nr:hypothetical protein SEVIR_2G152200v2 [Setaria viridis]